MASDSASGSVNPQSGNGSVNPENATGSVTAELKNEIQKIVMGIIPSQVQRAVKSALGEALPEAMKGIAELQRPQSANGEGNNADAEKLSAKARIEALEKQLTDFRNQAKEAEAKARDAALRSRVQAEVSKYLPASDPHHAAYMSLLYDQAKRFADVDGNPVVTFRREGGYQEQVALEQGVKELFDTELKHLTQKPKLDKLPSAGSRGATGNPIPGRNAQNGANRPSPLDQMLSDAAASALRVGANEE